MNAPPLIDQLADDIWQIYTGDKESAEQRIESYLADRFAELSHSESISVLEKLVDEFESSSYNAPADLGLDDSVMARISALLLGKDVSPSDLPSAELLDRMAKSLNTIFDSLNRLTGVIDRTLLGGQDRDRTIRQVIGSHLEGKVLSHSLEDHLEKIGRAFLTTQEAFRETAKMKMGEVLEEIDPARISEEAGRGLRMGPFRKARHFDIYELKYGKIKKWFESGRFIDDFLKEFENNCRKLTQSEEK